MTPQYKPTDPIAPYSGKAPYYHTTPASWLADVEHPNPHKQKPIAKPANLAKRQRRQPKRKAVIRFAKMRGWELQLLKGVAFRVALKLIIESLK